MKVNLGFSWRPKMLEVTGQWEICQGNMYTRIGANPRKSCVSDSNREKPLWEREREKYASDSRAEKEES